MVEKLRLVSRELVAEGTMAFHFEKPEGFEFRAGQAGDFILVDPPESDDEGNTRAFSLVHAPHEGDLVVATRLRDSAFKRVLRSMPIGSEVNFDGPWGDYTLHRRETTPAVFLIGGIGVTPVRSMISQATHDKTGHRLTLIHANDRAEAAPFVADFEHFASVNPNFTYVQTLSNPPQDWPGETGRIDEAMLRRHVPDLEAPIFYLSGPAGMVKAMRTLLMEAGADEDNIRTEEFSGY
ncbi:FAD-dependent oxidoreductase [Tessaracoccus lubricantis]|uniref:FAD-dependent oxidoreductase n=1 Tax=Tessaracoccus lubricantis TaxID=545543 RepID=A0ABP9FC00_9ACTN